MGRLAGKMPTLPENDKIEDYAPSARTPGRAAPQLQ
jgi:hypothetical protein